VQTKGIVVNEHSGEKHLAIEPIEIPPPGQGEVLIDVRAAGVNRADLLQRAGKYPPPPGAPATLGLEVSGVIEQLGKDPGDWKVGDEVYCLLPGGGYACHAIASAAMLWRKPKQWSFAQAAAIPEGLMTAFLNLVIEGEISIGERVLIEGGSSGVGTFAVQIAKYLGAQITATAGTPEKCARVKELGAHECLNYRTESVEGHGPFDLILDILGGPSVAHLKLLNLEGRIVFIATQLGPVGELDVRELMKRRARVIGSVLRSRTLEEKIAIKSQLDILLGQAVISGEIRPIIDAIIPLTEAERAHARMKAGEHFGKLVLTME